MTQTVEALRAELARQDAELAEAIDALGDIPPETEIAVASDWLGEIDEAVPRAATTSTMTSFAIRC